MRPVKKRTKDEQDVGSTPEKSGKIAAGNLLPAALSQFNRFEGAPRQDNICDEDRYNYKCRDSN